MRIVSFLAVLLLATSAHAQLHKCVNAQGKVEYRDSGCDDAGQSRGIGGSVSGIDAMSPSELRHAQSLMQAEKRIQPAPAAVIGAGNTAKPSAQDIKNLETAASSITLSAKERKFLQSEVSRAKAAAAGDGTYTQKDLDALRQRQADQNRIVAREREAAREDAGDIHTRAGGASQTASVIRARQEEEDRANARRAAAAVQARQAQANAQPRTGFCDAGGCWVGTEHYQKGQGDTYYGPRGACRRIGDQLAC